MYGFTVAGQIVAMRTGDASHSLSSDEENAFDCFCDDAIRTKQQFQYMTLLTETE